MRRYLLAALTTAAAVTLFAGTAAAKPDPVSGDPRAAVHPGNAVEKDCGSLYEGSKAVTGLLTSSVDDSETYLDITAVDDDVEVVAVIVKGSDGYNEYLPSGLGVLPWLDLHSPLASSGKPAQISHWFACGVVKTSTTTTTTTESTTSSTSETSTTSSTSTTDTSTPSSSSSSSSASVTTTTTTSANVAPVADEDDLASTGFSGGWLVAVAAFLLLGGAALLLVTRLRARR